MAIYADLSTINYDVTNLDAAPQSDYTTGIDPKKIIKDPRFLKDLRDHYEGKNKYFANDEALIDQFYEDGSWRDLNTVGAVGGALEAYGSGKEDRERMKRIEQVWRQLPMFWQDGGRGAASAVPDIAKAIIADPLNLIPGVAAYKAGATAGRAAYVAGKSAPMLRGALSGTGKAAVVEGGISAGQEAVVNTATQLRDKQLGLRENFSKGELAASTALGGVLGAGVGTVLGAVPAALGSARGIEAPEMLNRMGVTREDLAAMSPDELDAFAQNVQRSGASGLLPPQQEAPVAEGAAAEPMNPVEAMKNKLETTTTLARDELNNLRRSGADEETVANATKYVSDLARLREGIARIEREAEQINVLEGSSDPQDIARAAKMREGYETFLSDFSLLLDDIDAAGSPEQFIETMRARNFGSGGSETPPATPDAAPEAAPAGDAPASPEAAGEAPPSPPSPEEVASAREAADAKPEAADAKPETTATTEEPELPPETKELLDRVAPKISPERVTFEEPDAPISVENRGRALAAGLDWRNITPSEKSEGGRVTKGAVSKAIRGRADDAETDAYAAQVEEELGDILDQIDSPMDYDPQELSDIVDMLARRDGVKSDADDLSALFRHYFFGGKAPARTDAEAAADSAVRAEQDRIDNLAETGQEMPASAYREYLNEMRKDPAKHADLIEHDLRTLEIFASDAFPDEAEQMIKLVRDQPDLAIREKMLDEIADLIEEAQSGVRLQEIRADEFTTTELKRIRRLSKSKQKELGVSKEVGDFFAQRQVIAERGTDTTAPKARKSQDAIDRASIMETAGRSTNGKIQSFLKRSGKGGLDPQYQVRKSGLAKEEAIIRAQASTGPSIVPYTTRTQEVVKGPDGDVTVKKGTTVFVDARTQRSYITKEYAEYVRGDRKGQKANAPAASKAANKKTVTDALASGDPNALATALRAIQDLAKRTAAKSDSPTGAPEPALSPPVTKGGQKLIVQSKANPDVVRMISQRQINEGKDISAIIGQKAGNPDSDPTNWIVKYAPLDAKARGAALRRLFDSLPEEANQTGKGARLEAGDATGAGEPLTLEEFLGVEFTATPEEADAINRLASIRGRASREGDGSMQFTGGQLRFALLEAEGMRWPKDKESISAVLDALKVGYQVQARIAPQGYIEDVVTRAESIEALQRIFEGRPAEELALMKRFMERLGGDRSVGPVMSRSETGRTSLRFSVVDNAKDLKGKTEIRFATDGKTNPAFYLPAHSTVQHEVAHWAYRYILTPQDRIDFWTAAQKYYDEDGELNINAIKERSIVGGELRVEGLGDIDGVTLNDLDGPQEFFANQFDMWASQNANLMVKDEAMWKRFARYIKAVFDRYYDKKRIDPDLEPLFAKILPPEEEKVFGLGVHANPQTKEGTALQSNFVQLQIAKMDLEDAIQRDSADGIISAAEAYRTLLLSMAKNDAETATGPLLALRRGKRGKGAGKLLRNRIRDIDEIMHGKPVFDEGGEEAFSPAAYEGLSLRADPQQVADDLTDFYYNGYNGRFEPRDGYPGSIKDWDATSLQKSFEVAERILNSRYQEAEGTPDLAAGRVPNSVKDESRPPRDGNGNVNPSKGKAQAKAAIGKRDERTDAQATADAKTPKGKRARADAAARPTVDVSTAPEVRSQPLTNLRKLYQKHKGTDYGDQVALEITRKIKAKPLPAKPVPVTQAVHKMGKLELNQALLDAIHTGDAKAVKMLAYETQRRIASRKSKREGNALIKPTFQQIRAGIIREKLDSTGVSASDGIPASARPSVREILGRMTHREPEVQVAARTITYRLLNLMNRTHKGTMEDGNDTLVSEVQRLVGFSPERSGTSIFVNTANPEFRELQGTVRRIASTVTRGQANPETRVIDLMQMIGRTSIPKNERDALVELFQQTDPSIRRMVEDRYPLPDGIEDSIRDEYLAISMFSELTSDFMKGTMRNDAITARVSGTVTASQISDVQRAMDRMAEYTAYVLNGHVGRPDLKEKYPHLDYYGDMFAGGNRPMYGALEGEYLVHTSYAADYAHDTLSTMDKAKRSRLDTYAKGGVGYDLVADMPVIFYHGTPNGKALRKANNPGVIFKRSEDGQYGPGYYLTANPHVASNVYAEKATPAAMMKQVEELGLSSDDEYFVQNDVDALFHTRRSIQMQRREYEEKFLIYGDEYAETQLLEEELKESIKVERQLVKDLEDAGVVTDPEVMPMVISLKNPVDFSNTKNYELEDPFVQKFMDELLKNEELGYEALRYIEDELSSGAVSGDLLYRIMSEGVGQSLRGSFNERVAVNQILKDMGHDGMITDHRNTLTMDRLTEASQDERLGAQEITHKTMVLFDAEQAKHIDAEEFNASDLRMYQTEAGSIPKGTVGDLVDLIINNQINKVEDVSAGQLGEVLEQQGTNGTLTGALMSMVKGRNLNAGEEQAVRKRSYFTYLQSQSERMKSMGATYLANFYKNHFPDLNQRFAGKFMPIMNALDALPDADGMLRGHFRASTAGVGQKQPASHRRIVKALRRGDGSTQERSLSDAERAIYRQIRATLADERSELNSLGFHVGNRGPNYVPQVWDGKKIAKRRTDFLTKMIEYYKVEARANGRTVDNAEAEAFANGVMLKLTEEGDDGVFIPARGSTKNPTFENVDYSRVIELDKYPEMLDELEEYLESDISALLVKYLEGSSRRVVHAKKLGVNSHAVNDYLMVASDGEAGIAKLLSTNKVFKTDRNAMNEDGKIEVFTLEDTIRMPFTGNEAASREFSRNLIEVHNSQGTAAARKILTDLYPSGSPPVTYQRRVDAIIGALEDFKGEPNSMNTQDEVFIEQAMKVAMKKPMDGQGAKSVVNVSRALRMTNNVTLLGFTTLTSLGDVVLPIIRSGQFGSWAKGLGKTVTDPHYRRMLKNVGVAMENIVHERMIHMYGSPDNKASHAFFNATLLTPWTDMNRTIAGATGFESFVAMQAKAFDKFVPGKSYAEQPAAYKTAHRFMQRYGMQDFLPNGPKSGMSLSTRAVADDLMVNDEAVRMGIIKFADEAIFQPNPNDIPLWAQTPIGALVFQLKSFPLMMSRLSGYVFTEAFKHGNFKPLFYLSTLGPAFGMATLSAKDIIQQRGGDDGESAALRKRNILKTIGYDEKVHGNEDDYLGWYVEGMLVMGGLGLLGDVIHSAVSQVDNGAYGQQRMWSTVLGPSFGLGNAVMQVGAGLADDGDNSNAKERSATREVATRIPILGGNRKFRESVVDAVAGEQGDKGSTGGWASGSWGSEWK